VADRNVRVFGDLLDANRRYQTTFHDPGVQGQAAKGLAVLTCIDSRIDPLAMPGLAGTATTAGAKTRRCSGGWRSCRSGIEASFCPTSEQRARCWPANSGSTGAPSPGTSGGAGSRSVPTSAQPVTR
jgi:hypothetical protein